MKNFGTVIDNFDAVTKQYVDNKVPTDEHIKGIKVDNATSADTAKKVKNAFTYKAHNKAAGTVVPITYDGSKAASLDFSADDFAYDYSSGKDIKVKLVDKGYATSVKVNGNTIAPSGGVVDIGTVLTDASAFATAAQGTKADTALQTVTLESGTNIGTVKITVNGTATDNVAVKGLKSAAYTESSAYATAAQGTKADNAMPKAGGAFTGAVTVQAPTAEMNPATKQYVDTAINAVKQFEYQVVTELPTAAQATMGKIYLVAHSHNPSDGKPDSYDEFITVKSGSTYKWERIGNTDIDLSEYVPTTRKINNKALSSDITLYPTDVGVTEANFPGLNKTGTVTGVNMNGATKTPSSGVVDIGTVLTDESKFATAAQGSNADSALAKANANSTEISNIKNGTNGTKVKYAEHADAADSATSAGTADKVANGLTLGGGVVYDGYKALSITAGDKISITGGPGGVSIGLAHSVMPSTYNKVTVDGYGTVTAGENVDYLTSHQAIKKLNTNNTTAQDANASEAIAGSGTINLHKVAKTGSYNDLLYKPTIPAAANNGMLTIQKNGTTVQTFTANQSSSVTADITVPTSIDGLGGGTLTSPLKVTGGDGANASKILLDNSNNGQITDKGTATLLGFVDTTNFIVGHQNYGLRLRGKTARPQYTTDNANYNALALYSDIPDISGKLDKTTYEVNKTIAFGQDGALYVGKFKVYDTNVTFEITSTTDVTYSGKLVIATQNYVIKEAKVYGDAANTVAPNIYIKPSSESDPYIEVYFKPESWSKNVIHIYGSEIKAEPTDVCTSIPSVPSTATQQPINALTNTFITSGGSVKSLIDYNKADERIKIGYAGVSLASADIKYIAGYTAGDNESVARIKDIPKDALKSWLEYATVATSGSYNDLVDKPKIPTFSLSGTVLTITL